MAGMEMVHKILVSLNHLTIMAQEIFTEFSCHESFKSYTKVAFMKNYEQIILKNAFMGVKLVYHIKGTAQVLDAGENIQM
jgi:hypothetical protein